MTSETPPVGPIERLMVEDHVELDRLLDAASAGEAIDATIFATFRERLLRHIAMEEKVLLPYARASRAGEPLALAPALRADHGRIAKLLVRSPTPAGFDALREILGPHNALEEGPSGLYATCDRLAGDDASAVVARLKAQPAVPLAPYYDGPLHARPHASAIASPRGPRT